MRPERCKRQSGGKLFPVLLVFGFGLVLLSAAPRHTLAPNAAAQHSTDQIAQETPVPTALRRGDEEPAGLPTAIGAGRKAAARGAVATEAPRATHEALKVLEEGGNAADAAVVAALVGGIVNSSSSGIGGGGFVNYWNASAQRAIIIDFRESAPARLEAEAFERRPFDSRERGRWVGVPGEVKGLFALHTRFGRLPWEDVVERAARVAREGFRIGPHMARVLELARPALAQDPGLSALWLSRGRVPSEGARIYNPRLATTLSRIAKRGPSAFYEGPVAAEIVETVQAAGGALTLEDLRSYAPVVREPLRIEFAGQEVYTMPLPSAGGYMLAHTLALYEPRELRALGLNSPAYVHALAESFRAALYDRMTVFGDPAFEQVDLRALLAPDRMRARRARIGGFRTHRIEDFESPESGTHHLVTADAEGNVASMTVTVNRAFGAKLLAPKSGVLLNDELDDFTAQRWVSGLGVAVSPNRARPGARPLSSMTPTLVVREGRVTLAAGGSGGMTIATNVSQLVVSHLVFGVPAAGLVQLPRFLIPLGKDTISAPPDWDEAFVKDLVLRGEAVGHTDFGMHAVQAVSWDGGAVSAGADPRKHGLALVR